MMLQLMSFLSIVMTFRYFCASTELASIGLCTVVGENSILDIREWVEYHSFIGIRNFYIFNHGPKNSTKILSSSLAPFITNGIVKLRTFPVGWKSGYETLGIPDVCGPKIQCWALTTCAREYRHQHNFIASIDVDEFIVMRVNQTLSTFLGDYYKGGLLMHWRIFGSSGFIHRPEGGVLRNYNHCCDNETLSTSSRTDNPRGYTKSITSTTAMNDHTYCNPHLCMDILYYDENMRADNSKVNVSFSKVALNHYRVKSWDDFTLKRNAMKAIGGTHGKSYFDQANLNTTDFCYEAALTASKLAYKAK
jgi:Glycosyltransferase family 92